MGIRGPRIGLKPPSSKLLNASLSFFGFFCDFPVSKKFGNPSLAPKDFP